MVMQGASLGWPAYLSTPFRRAQGCLLNGAAVLGQGWRLAEAAPSLTAR